MERVLVAILSAFIAVQSAATPTKAGLGTDASPLVVKQSEAEQAAARDREAKKEIIDTRIAVATEDLAKKTWYLALGTAALAVATAALFIITYRMARDAKSTFERQAVETAKSLSLSEMAASVL
jgi:hypothetical protein